MELHDIYRAVQASGQFRVAATADGDAMDCAGLATAVSRGRACLRRRGLVRGDVLVYHGGQCTQALVLFWAAVLEGVVFVPVDASWPPYLLGKACERVRPALVMADDALLAAWDSVAGATEVLPLQELDALPEDARDACLPAVAAQAGDPAAFLFTSGSTGDPKAVVLSHGALADSARRVLGSFDWQAGEVLVNLPDPHTMSGLRNAFIAAPLAGMAWQPAPMRERANAYALLDMLVRARPQRLVAAPVLLRHVNLLGARVDAGAFAGLRALYCTGTDLSQEEVRRFHARYGVPVLNYYGLTETGGLCLGQDLHDWSPDDDSLGRAVGCELRVVDEQGVERGTGEIGELQVWLAHPMSGYLDDPQATAAMFDGDWLRTGDLVRRDASGRVRIVGRRDSFIKTLATEKVQPREVEAVLDLHPAVLESAVYGLVDPAGGERLAALVVLREEAGLPASSDAALAEFVRERLGSGRVPAVFRRTCVIPRSGNGKILREQLKDRR